MSLEFWYRRLLIVSFVFALVGLYIAFLPEGWILTTWNEAAEREFFEGDPTVVGIALLFISTNWTSIKQWDRSNGLTESSIQPVSLGIIFAMVAAWALAKTAYAMIRTSLDTGLRVPKDQVLVGWHPILFLLPLLFHSRKTETSRLEDGTLLTHTYGYGTDHGWVLFLLESIVFVLIQYLARMPRAVASRRV